ncbi:MAG: 23S rRNA (guanosine(2251)-2'-O)-methyltransferase RlmB, partial [Gammaproteobacteria bacterium]
MKEKSIFVYGYHAVRAALQQAPLHAQVLWLQQGRDDQRAKTLCHQAQTNGVTVQWANQSALDKKAEEGVHQGFVLQTRPPVFRGDHDLLSDAEQRLAQQPEQWPCFVVLDGVTDPHNVGACLRTVAAAGAAGVILARHDSPKLSAVVAKVSSGAVFSVPVYQVGNVVRSVNALQKLGYWSVAAALGEHSQSLYALDLNRPLIWVMGAEGQGLKRLMLDTCDFQAMI